LLLLVGCGVAEAPSATWDEVLDPAACAECHPDQYAEWAGSMHAYTGVDPIFKAMNARAQRESDGALGDYCVGCHSPMAVREGWTEDGTDLDEVPAHLRGVTCVFCHTALLVPVDHNSSHVLSGEPVMRGAIADPVPNAFHASEYGILQDRNEPGSSELCGSCHCVFTPQGVHVERTNREWKASVFNDQGPGRLSCSGCHMRGRDGTAAVGHDGPERRLHDHSFPGVDTALTAFPGKEDQAEAIQQELDFSVQGELCVGPATGGVEIVVQLDNVGSGHSFPSGAAYDRRVWVEVVAYDEANAVLFESGVVADGEPVVDAMAGDPYAWEFRDRHYDANGDPVDMSWNAVEVEGALLPFATTNDPSDPAYVHAVRQAYPVRGTIPARVTARVRIRATGLDILDTLIANDGLDPALRDLMPTWDLGGTVLEWTGPVGSCVR